MPRSSRRAVLAQALAATALGSMARAVSATARGATDLRPERRWYEAAASMKRMAESWGDQPYGAVLVTGGAIIGFGPSRVVQRRDPTAHAEREAIRDAQRRLGQTSLAGSVLYSTSRPCPACESAAAKANVARMIYGTELSDAGEPRE